MPELMKTGFTSDMDGLAKVSNEFEQDRELMAFSRMYVKTYVYAYREEYFHDRSYIGMMQKP